MNRQVKISAAIAGLFDLVAAGLLGLGVAREDDKKKPSSSSSSPSAGTDSAASARLVRPDSHILGEKGASEVAFVEFLDFECESCRAAYPAVEQLRKEYAGKVTFVARYFPLPGHFNADRAASAVEAAAQQGKFEDMYSHMYEAQEQWGEQRVPLDDLFRSFAKDLGLNMDRYDTDYASKATAARVKKDVTDGTALGVSGTPTFFLDGKLIEPQSYEDLTESLDAALAN